MMNLQGGIPADWASPERPPLNISLNNPPFVPQFPVPGFMLDLVPVISAAVAMDVQQNARNSPARTFTYNILSRNNYQNELFVSIVIGVCDWVCMALAEKRFGSPEQAAQMLLPKMVEMFIALQISQYTELQQGDGNVRNHVMRLCQDAAGLQNDIMSFKNSQVYAQMIAR